MFFDSKDARTFCSLTRPVDLYKPGFDASWELDLFGKPRRPWNEKEGQGAALDPQKAVVR